MLKTRKVYNNKIRKALFVNLRLLDMYALRGVSSKIVRSRSYVVQWQISNHIRSLSPHVRLSHLLISSSKYKLQFAAHMVSFSFNCRVEIVNSAPGEPK